MDSPICNKTRLGWLYPLDSRYMMFSPSRAERTLSLPLPSAAPGEIHERFSRIMRPRFDFFQPLVIDFHNAILSFGLWNIELAELGRPPPPRTNRMHMRGSMNASGVLAYRAIGSVRGCLASRVYTRAREYRYWCVVATEFSGCHAGVVHWAAVIPVGGRGGCRVPRMWCGFVIRGHRVTGV